MTVSSPGDDGPKVEAAGLATADADVIGRSSAVGRQPLEMLLEREHRIDGRKHVLRRAEGKIEGDLSVELAGFLESERAVVLGEEIAHLPEDLGFGALEAVDRLLLVADREHRAQPARPGAVAGREFGGQGAQDRPIFKIRVLRLVDQKMLDRGIELVEHEGRGGPHQQSARRRDQIVEIERGPFRFELGETRPDGSREREQGQAASARLERVDAIEEAQQTLGLGLQALLERRDRRCGQRRSTGSFAL